jgi:hypothetical protein
LSCLQEHDRDIAHSTHRLSISQPKAHTALEVDLVSPFAGVWKLRREDLRSQRAALAKEFEKTPEDLSLALQIKAIDDRIAECTEYLVKEKQLPRSPL